MKKKLLLGSSAYTILAVSYHRVCVVAKLSGSVCQAPNVFRRKFVTQKLVNSRWTWEQLINVRKKVTSSYRT